jgi:hypothetical protein
VLSVPDVCKRLGIKPRKLKAALWQKVLPPADLPAEAGFAAYGFSEEWVTAAKPIVATEAFKRASFPRG